MTQNKDIPTRAIDHARVAAAQSKMKGIPASDAGVALMAQALCLIYNIDLMQATEMVRPLTMLANDILQRGLVDQLAASQGVTAEQAEIMINQARVKDCVIPAEAITLLDEAAAVKRREPDG